MGIRAVVIDAKQRKLREVSLDSKDAQKAIEQITGAWLECPLKFPNSDVLYVNEEGLFGKPEHFFCFAGESAYYPGIGVIVGQDESGNIISATSTHNDLFIRFMDQKELNALVNPRKFETGK